MVRGTFAIHFNYNKPSYLTPNLGLGYLEPSALINAHAGAKAGGESYASHIIAVGEIFLAKPIYRYLCIAETCHTCRIYFGLYMYVHVYLLVSLPGPSQQGREEPGVH